MYHFSRITLYIDPGTGSMLFTILLGVLGAAVFALRNLWNKLRFRMSAGRGEKQALQRAGYAIFTDSKRYWNVFGPICEEFERRGLELEYLTASPDDPALERTFSHVKCRFIGEGNKAFSTLNTLRADVLLSSTPGLEVYQWKRSKQVGFYAHILHMASDPTTYRMFGLDFYDAVLLSGEYQVRQQRQLEQLRHLKAKELPLVGQPYLDAMRARLDKARPLAPHPKTVLLAPSWGKSAIFARYGGEIIDALLQTGCHVIVRPHPQSFTSEKELIEGLMQRYPASAQLEWDRSNDNFETLARSDLLISDFSGVIFDFALVFDGPVIYADTAFDKAPYDACWLEEDLWTFRILPKLGLPLTKEELPKLGELIDRCLHESRFREGRAEARQQAWCCMGEGAKNTVDYLTQVRARLTGGAEEGGRKA